MLSKLCALAVESLRRLKALKGKVLRLGIVETFSRVLALASQRLTERRLGRFYLNPFTGFVLSKWFISSEVEGLRLRHLNFSSRKLKESNASKRSIP
mgnify:CR=1 FL=1